MALTTNNTHYWKMDNGNDSIGSLNLASNGTVTFTAGLIGNAATVVSGGFMDVATQPTTYAQSGTAFSVNGWIRFTSTIDSNDHMVFWFRTTTGGNIRQFNLGYMQSTTSWQFTAFPNSGGATTSTTFSASPSTSTWYMLTGVYDGTNLSLYLNGSAVGTPTAWVKGTFSTTAQHSYTLGQSNTTNQQTDEIGFWERALTTGEITQLYNGGAGLQYPYTTTANGNFLSLF